MSKILVIRFQILGEGWQKLGINLGITRWISMGKEFTQLGESGVLRVVHIVSKLFTKLSTEFSTAVVENCSTIHRLYYYNYFN